MKPGELARSAPPLDGIKINGAKGSPFPKNEPAIPVTVAPTLMLLGLRYQPRNVSTEVINRNVRGT